jgi:glutathione S-transferase
MGNPVLIIGNKNYSSWSLRPWLLMKAAGIAFDEVRIALYQQHSTAAIQSHAPAGRARYRKVPILHDGALQVWDSLAICEYVAERWPESHGWPTDRAARARARSVSAEMHSGFQTLRARMPMNCRRPRGPIDPAAQDATLRGEIDRVIEIWTGCGAVADACGPFLFGRFGIADAMYAPVVLRLSTYEVALPAPAQAYVDAILAMPALQNWISDARSETDVLDQFET